MFERLFASSGGRARLALLALLLASAPLIFLWLQIGAEGALAWLAHVSDWIAHHRLEAALVLALWSFVTQLAVVPSGSLTMLAAGFFLGWPAGLIYYAAMVAAGQVVFAWAKAGLATPTETMFTRIRQRWPRFNLERARAVAQREGVMTTAVLRILPVMPSAPAAIFAGALGVRTRSFLIGTLLTGWIRPIAFSWAGATLTNLAEVSGFSPMRLIGPALALLAATILLPMWAAARFAQSTEK